MNIFGATRAPRNIIFGTGQRHALAASVAALGRRALICTDERMAADPLFTDLVDRLTAAGIETKIFDRSLAELPVSCILECVEFSRPFAPEVVVGIGGGSCLDLAKITALLLTHGGRVQDFYGEFKVPGPVLPLIAIPTTAGTGSEVTPVAVMGDPERALKVGISSPHLIPHTAICDPELTYSCPPGLTAVSGADALGHAIEAFTAISRPPTSDITQNFVFVGKNVLSDHHALTAMACIVGGLERACRDGNDAEARAQLMLGSLSAGLAFGTAGTAAAHAIQYPVGALTKTAHGMGVAVLLPYVMEYNRATALPEFARIAGIFGHTSAEGDTQALASAAIDSVAKLFATIGIPGTLADLGLAADKQDWVAEQSLLSARLVNNNPRPLQLPDMQALVLAAFSGNRQSLRAPA